MLGHTLCKYFGHCKVAKSNLLQQYNCSVLLKHIIKYKNLFLRSFINLPSRLSARSTSMTIDSSLWVILLKFFENTTNTGYLEFYSDSKHRISLLDLLGDIQGLSLTQLKNENNVVAASNISSTSFLDILMSLRYLGWNVISSNSHTTEGYTVQNFYLEIKVETDNQDITKDIANSRVDEITSTTRIQTAQEKTTEEATNKSNGSKTIKVEEKIGTGGATTSMIKQLAHRRKLNNNSIHPLLDGDKPGATLNQSLSHPHTLDNNEIVSPSVDATVQPSSQAASTAPMPPPGGLDVPRLPPPPPRPPLATGDKLHSQDATQPAPPAALGTDIASNIVYPAKGSKVGGLQALLGNIPMGGGGPPQPPPPPKHRTAAPDHEEKSGITGD